MIRDLSHPTQVIAAAVVALTLTACGATSSTGSATPTASATVRAGASTSSTAATTAKAIVIERPVSGETLSGAFVVTGTADTFEATFQLQLLRADGQAAITQVVHATSGTGTRGSFSTTISPPADLHGSATLRAFELSAKDGSPINKVEIPIVLG